MSLLTFISKLRYGSYKDSNKASVYEEIAKSNSVLPQHVYEIAHGKKPKTSEEQSIFDELIMKDIIVSKEI